MASTKIWLPRQHSPASGYIAGEDALPMQADQALFTMGHLGLVGLSCLRQKRCQTMLRRHKGHFRPIAVKVLGSNSG